MLQGNRRSRSGRGGFSLIEMLLVLAIIGIISAIAIPSYLGQRRRARVIGDAMATCQAIRMAMEQYKADNGNYGPAGATATWTYSIAIPHYPNIPALSGYTSPGPIPQFTPTGTSGINFILTVGATGFTYTLNATDNSISGTPSGATLAQAAYQTNEMGQELFRYR